MKVLGHQPLGTIITQLINHYSSHEPLGCPRKFSVDSRSLVSWVITHLLRGGLTTYHLIGVISSIDPKYLPAGHPSNKLVYPAFSPEVWVNEYSFGGFNMFFLKNMSHNGNIWTK